MSKPMPVIFFGHGNPMNSLERNSYTEKWAQVGREIPKPKAILCVSAHWYVPGIAVTAMNNPRTIHDFGGFPKELFAVEYPASGSPELANRVQELLAPNVVTDDEGWGLDHGTWSVLCHVFPEADVPVVQLSIEKTQPASFHYQLAGRLAPLRDEDILFIGCGNIVHNLQTYSWGKDALSFDWAVRFEKTVRELVLSGNHAPLIAYETLGTDALLSVPTPEHFLPLLYILALQREADEIGFPVEGFDGGSISMLSVQVG